MISLVWFLFISAVFGAKWCRYDCQTEYGNSYGNANFGAPHFFQPYHRTTGFSPRISKTLCDSGEFSESNHPVAVIGMPTPTFVALCANSVKVFEANKDDINLVSELELVELGKGFVTTGYKTVTVSANNKVTVYDLKNGVLSEKATFGDTTVVTAAGFATSTSLFGFFKSSIKVLEFASGNIKEHSGVPKNDLFYAVVDGSGSIYYCNSEEVVQVKTSGKVNTLSTSDLGFSCTSVLASRTNTIVISASAGPSGSVLAEIDTEAFESVSVIGSYPFQITGVSREAWKEGSSSLVAYLAVQSEKGVFVIVERHPSQPRGAVYSHFNSTGPLVGRPTLSTLANPVVFDIDKVISYTNDFLVKFFDTEFGTDLDDFEFYNFLPSPLVYQGFLLAFTTTGEAVLYSHCTRYAVGEEVPENACPIPEIPDVETDTYWITIFSGVAAGVSVPFLGEALCNKLKLFGKEEDDDVEVELYSEDEEEFEEEDEEYLTPQPFKTREI